MNGQPGNASATSFAEAREAEGTLRLIAELAAPDGLEDRVKAALQKAPARHQAKVLDWPGRRWTQSAWARGAAVAAIVIVVGGGSWGVYSRVQTHQTPIAIPHVGGAGGFSSANAVRTPKTLDAPTVMPRASQESTTVKKQADGKKKAPLSKRAVATQSSIR